MSRLAADCSEAETDLKCRKLVSPSTPSVQQLASLDGDHPLAVTTISCVALSHCAPACVAECATACVTAPLSAA